MKTQTKALKMALEALEDNHEEIVHNWALFEKNKNAIHAIKKALSEPEHTNTRPWYTIDELSEWIDKYQNQEWRNAAIMLGEKLSSVGPDGYYNMEAKDWLDWAMENVKLAQTQEPVAWVYPEGLEALKAGKPWTAYGTRQEPDNTALYLSPQPDIAPYAWVTFTPYGDEDDVWYENPEGQLLEGWTYKPLYDTTPPRKAGEK